MTSHSSAVSRIDADGSRSTRNPWGPGNSADGGGELKISPDDVTD